jgi:hypothetical protein
MFPFLVSVTIIENIFNPSRGEGNLPLSPESVVEF